MNIYIIDATVTIDVARGMELIADSLWHESGVVSHAIGNSFLLLHAICHQPYAIGSGLSHEIRSVDISANGSLYSFL
jgi:hypothetical protein